MAKNGAGTVGGIMSKDVPLTDRDALLPDVLVTMSTGRFGCAGITDGDKLVGVITDGDVRRYMEGNGKFWHKDVAINMMSRNPRTVSANTLVSQAVKLMNYYRVTQLFVLEDGKPTGIVHLHDCIKE